MERSSFLDMVKKSAKRLDLQQKKFYLDKIEKFVDKNKFIDWLLSNRISIKKPSSWEQIKVKVMNSNISALDLKKLYENTKKRY